VGILHANARTLATTHNDARRLSPAGVDPALTPGVARPAWGFSGQRSQTYVTPGRPSSPVWGVGRAAREPSAGRTRLLKPPGGYPARNGLYLRLRTDPARRAAHRPGHLGERPLSSHARRPPGGTPGKCLRASPAGRTRATLRAAHGARMPEIGEEVRVGDVTSSPDEVQQVTFCRHRENASWSRRTAVSPVAPNPPIARRCVPAASTPLPGCRPQGALLR
jgi:hypothetical protein